MESIRLIALPKKEVTNYYNFYEDNDISVNLLHSSIKSNHEYHLWPVSFVKQAKKLWIEF